MWTNINVDNYASEKLQAKEVFSNINKYKIHSNIFLLNCLKSNILGCYEILLDTSFLEINGNFTLKVDSPLMINSLLFNRSIFILMIIYVYGIPNPFLQY